jgi:flagellar basal body rod protein FlgF
MKSETEINSVRIIRTMHDHLSKRGFDVSQGKLMETIFEFIANNEDEMLRMLEEKKNFEIKMKKWLETPVEAEKTDALKEHDLVV